MLPEQYSLRPTRMEDLPAAVELFNACSIDNYGRAEFHKEHIQAEWTQPHYDSTQSSRVVIAHDGQMVGYVEVWDLHHPPVAISVWGRVHPQYERQGIGTALMEWAEQRARAAIDRCPPEARVVLHVRYKADHVPTLALMEALGFKAIRYTWMMMRSLETPPPDPVVPAGITLRAMHFPDELEAVYRTFQDSFQDHFGFVAEPFETAFPRWRHMMVDINDFDPGMWFVAVDQASGNIAGVSLCELHAQHDREAAWVNILGVRREWRQHGLGLALLYHSFGEMYRRGQRRVSLGVDASSLTGATRLYERAGMSVDREFTLFEKELRPGVELITK